MRSLAFLITCSVIALLAVTGVHANPDDHQTAPPCHGHNENDCRDDPQPDKGRDCERSDDHVCSPTATPKPPTTTPASTVTPVPSTSTPQPPETPTVTPTPVFTPGAPQPDARKDWLPGQTAPAAPPPARLPQSGSGGMQSE